MINYSLTKHYLGVLQFENESDKYMYTLYFYTYTSNIFLRRVN